MRELAMGPVNLAPLIEQGQNVIDLPGQQPVDRSAARSTVRQPIISAAPRPAPQPTLGQIQYRTGLPDRPTVPHGGVDQVEQPGLRGRVNPGRDLATQPQPPFPSTNVNRTASSLHASDSRATSALACSSS